MHTDAHKHAAFKENHRAEERSRSSVLSQLLLRKRVKVEPFSTFQAPSLQSRFARKGCSALLSPFRSSAIALSSSASQQSPAGYAAERERNRGETFFSPLCHTFNCPKLNQIPVSHMGEREREHAEHNPATVSSHLLPPQQLSSPRSLVMAPYALGDRGGMGGGTNLGKVKKNPYRRLSPACENDDSRALFAESSWVARSGRHTDRR